MYDLHVGVLVAQESRDASEALVVLSVLEMELGDIEINIPDLL